MLRPSHSGPCWGSWTVTEPQANPQESGLVSIPESLPCPPSSDRTCSLPGRVTPCCLLPSTLVPGTMWGSPERDNAPKLRGNFTSSPLCSRKCRASPTPGMLQRTRWLQSIYQFIIPFLPGCMDPKVVLRISRSQTSYSSYIILQIRRPWLHHSPLALPQQIPPEQCPSDAELKE